MLLRAGLLVLTCAAASVMASGVLQTRVTPDAADPVAAVEAWRTKHETDYRRDWVSIAGLDTLKQGVNRAGSGRGNEIVLPASTPASLGKFVLEGGTVRFEPTAGVDVQLRGK